MIQRNRFLSCSDDIWDDLIADVFVESVNVSVIEIPASPSTNSIDWLTPQPSVQSQRWSHDPSGDPNDLFLSLSLSLSPLRVSFESIRSATAETSGSGYSSLRITRWIGYRMACPASYSPSLCFSCFLGNQRSPLSNLTVNDELSGCGCLVSEAVWSIINRFDTPLP